MRIGFRDTALIGMVLGVTGTVLTALLPQQSPTWHVALHPVRHRSRHGAVLGSPMIVAIQSVVGWDRRGVVTGTNMFFRSMGSALGAAVFGAIANATLVVALRRPAGRRRRAAAARHRRDHAPRSRSRAPVADFARDSLYLAAHNVFIALAVTAALIALALTVLPRRTEPLVFEA